MAEIPGLDLTTLAHAVPALTMHLGTVLAEAAAVCLESNEHPQGVPLSVRGESSERFGLTWRPMTDTMRRAYNNEDGTEIGACGVAILLVREISGMAVIERSAKGTGFDYWLGDTQEMPFQRKGRLEVSGIMRGVDKDVKARVRLKREQTKRSDATQLDAWIVIVEFGRPLAEVVKR